VPDEEPRSRAAREAAERALMRVVRNYGSRPEFVVLGGLLPDLLCTATEFRHAGTTDVDVQVDLEIACGSLNAPRLERALREAGFEPDANCIWCWRDRDRDTATVVKFELLADLEDVPAGESLRFNDCEALGAANLRGTRFASLDVVPRQLSVHVDGAEETADVNFTGLAGFLLAKCAAALSRRMTKDWYDIAFVLLHNDAGGPEAAAELVHTRFGNELASVRTALDDLRANFAAPDAQGPQAYASQMAIDHPGLDRAELLADSVVAVRAFCRILSGSPRRER
jgi:hypothetical protein